MSIDDLLRMKNINYDAAQSLIETRNQRGTFQSLNPVKKTLLEHGVSESYYETFLTPVFTVGGGGGNVSTGSREASQQNSSPLKQSEPTLRDSKDSESGDKQKEPSNSSLPDMNDL